MMKFERPTLAKAEDEVHSVRITLSSKNMKNLEKVCAELVSGAKDKKLKIKEDEVMPEKVSSITTRSAYEPGFCTPSPYQRQSRKGGTNLRWTPAMTRFLLPFLIDQANLGLKMGRAFKRDAFLAAAEAVTQKFKLRITGGNVSNHLKTIKARFQQIRKLQSLSNTTWDEKERKITMDQKDYAKHIAANPRDEPFLNKHIDMYNEMLFICGDDQTLDSTADGYTKDDGYTKENHSSSFTAHEVNEDGHEMDDEDLGIEEVGEAPPPPLPSSVSPQRSSSKSPRVSTSSYSSGRSIEKRKRRHLGDKIEYLACQIGELAEAIRSSRKGISVELFSEVMKCEGYDEVSLCRAFDYLHEHDNLARGFLAKNQNLRQAWLLEFFAVGDQML